MAIQIQLRQGTTTEHNTFTGAVGEVTVDTTKKTLVVHDGVTAGGTPLLKADQLVDSTTTVKGVIELATQSEVNNGTETTLAVTPATLSNTFPIQTKVALNATGGAPIYACRAWVNFNGTGTPSIRASGNVSSITDNGVGDYSINFISSMPSANYCVTGYAGRSSVGATLTGDSYGGNTVMKANIQTRLLGSNVDTVDADFVSITIFV